MLRKSERVASLGASETDFSFSRAGQTPSMARNAVRRKQVGGGKIWTQLFERPLIFR